jgi:hypothetical protein
MRLADSPRTPAALPLCMGLRSLAYRVSPKLTSKTFHTTSASMENTAMTLKMLHRMSLFVLAAACSSSLFAQSRQQITQPVNAAVRHTLSNSVPAQVHAATDTGRASGSLPMKDMLLRLKPSATQTAALAKFVADVQNPRSANYHHWLTPSQYGARFGVTDADAQTITAWLTSNGFTINEVAQGKRWIRFSGTSNQVERAFATEIHSYTLAGAQRYSNATAISVPEALSPAVAGVLSLNSFTKAPQHTRVAQLARGENGKMIRTVAATSTAESAALAAIDPKNASLAVRPNFTSQGAPEETFLAPGDFAKIYNTAPLTAAGTDGTGVSIAIVGRSDISLSDVEAFRTVFALPYNDPTLIHANDDPGVIPGDDEEAILDVEWSGAVAPKAKINYVIGGSTYSTDGVDISAAYIVDNVVAPIMSISFGECEQAVSQDEMDFYSDLWQQATAEGISVFVAAGDAGSSMCDIPNEYIASPYGLGVNALASTPYNTAVGGTEFADSDPNTYWNVNVNTGLSSVKGYIPENVWNESCNPNLPVSADNCFFDPDGEGTYATGGGASSCAVHPDGSTPSLLTGLYDCTGGYPKPSWQTGTGVPQDGVRDLPDVALAAAAAHDGFMLCYDGSCQWTTNSDGSISLQSASIIGGTSAAAPSMAGIMALVEQKNGTFQGLANYQLYKLAAQQSAGSCNASSQTDPTQTSSCVFNDVTAGSNALSCVAGRTDCTVPIAASTVYDLLAGYSAGAGYDLASGLGSVNAANLVAAWGATPTIATATTLAVSSTSFAHGTPVNVTAAVAPGTGSGTPVGEVTLKAAGTGVTTAPVATGDLASGQYAASLTSLPGGTYNLTAEYSGDGTYAGSTSTPVALTVTPEASVMTAQTLSPSRFYILGRRPIVPSTATTLGNNFFIQVSMAGASGGGIPTGSIALSNGTTSFGTFPLDHTGSIYVPCGPETTCDLPLGSYNFTATYSGDSSFNTSTTTLPFSITKGQLNYSVGLSSQTPPAGSTVIAQVYFEYDPAVLPTGAVTLTRDDTGAVLATGTIGSNGIATIPFTAAAGQYYVKASYAGDTNYTPGILLSYEQLTTTGNGGIATSTTMTASSTTATIGGRTQVSITVTPSQVTATAPLPSGTVTLHMANGLVAAPVTLVAGHATSFITWSNAGVQSIYATYDGDANFAGSNTALINITVAQATPALQLSTPASIVAVGAQTSVTASVVSALQSTQAATPTGTVQFFDSVSGAASQAIGTPQPINTGNGSSLIATLAPYLAAGTHVITAQYSGDANWTAATSAAVTIQATTPSFTAAATPTPATVTAGQTATISVNTQSILGFSSPIAISCGTLPVGITCTSATILPGASGSITLTTAAPGIATATASAKSDSRLGFVAPTALSLACVLFLISPKRRRYASLLGVLVVAGIVGGLSGCAGSSPSPTSIALTSSSTKVASGSSVALLATISSSNTVAGSVTFYDGTTAIGSPATITNGAATLTTSSLTVGTHAITAKYAGDGDDLASSSSDVLNQTITGQFTLTINATAGTQSQPISLPVTLQ